MKIQPCICSSNNAFKHCCQPLLSGETPAKTPQALMRSRFSAFALGGHGPYLVETWAPEVGLELDPIELSQRSLNWQRLTIVTKYQKNDHGLVEFKAYYLDDEGQENVHHEISTFTRRLGRWLYVDGEIVN